MVNYFIYGGIRSDSVGIGLLSEPEFTGAKPIYTVEQVPGRNGALSCWDGSYENTQGTINCYQYADSVDQAARAASLLALSPTYKKLQVSNDPAVYRMARITTAPAAQFLQGVLNQFTLEFDCKPQVYLVSGDDAITVSTTGTKIRNDYQPAKPLMTIYGTAAGTVTISGKTITVNSISTSVTVDCETMDAYKDGQNKNSTISCADFPVLQNGDNTVSFTGGITSVEIIPRWWTV